MKMLNLKFAVAIGTVVLTGIAAFATKAPRVDSAFHNVVGQGCQETEVDGICNGGGNVCTDGAGNKWYADNLCTATLRTVS